MTPEQIKAVLEANGLSDNAANTLHSWRCEHPEIYGPCSCLQELVNDLAALLPEATEAAEWGVWSGVSIAGPINNWDSYQRFLNGGEGLQPTHHRTRTSYADRVTEWTEVPS